MPLECPSTPHPVVGGSPLIGDRRERSCVFCLDPQPHMISPVNLDDALLAARDRYVSAHPVSQKWHQRAEMVMPGGNTRTVLHFDPFPLRAVRAEGRHLYDADGHRYVDLLGNYTAGLFGHSPEHIISAVRHAIDQGISVGAPHEAEVRLAELLVGRFPSIVQIRFTNSGTEANLMALAAAKRHTGRDGVIVFDGAYHGGVITFGANGREANIPHRWLVARYNDLLSVESIFADDPGGIACILVEPVQGGAGCIPADVEFLRGLRSLADEHGAVLVFDEVMTSRLGPGGIQGRLGVMADLTTLGKYLAGGMSFGAFGGTSSIMQVFDPSRGGDLGHAGTFNNNVVSMAAGVAGAEALTPALLDALNARGDRLRDGLNAALSRVGMCATGVGSMLTVHPVPGPVRSIDDLTGGDDRLRELWFFACLEAGFYVARRGFIALSLEVTDADIDLFLEVVEDWARTIKDA